MHSDWPFADYPKERVDHSQDVVYLLDPEFRIIYCNPAWDTFAIQNKGYSARCQNVSGTDLFSYITEDLQPAYVSAFASARILGRCELRFECSSPSQYRHFRMRIRLLRQGYAVMNSLEVERRHDRETLQPDYSHFERGAITLCAGCRRTKNRYTPDRWDWVPYFLNDGFVSVAHRLCPACSVYYGAAVPSPEQRGKLAS